MFFFQIRLPLSFSLSKLPLVATENKCRHFHSKIRMRWSEFHTRYRVVDYLPHSWKINIDFDRSRIFNRIIRILTVIFKRIPPCERDFIVRTGGTTITYPDEFVLETRTKFEEHGIEFPWKSARFRNEQQTITTGRNEEGPSKPKTVSTGCKFATKRRYYTHPWYIYQFECRSELQSVSGRMEYEVGVNHYWMWAVTPT